MAVIILYLFILPLDVFIRDLARSNATVLQRVVYVYVYMCCDVYAVTTNRELIIRHGVVCIELQTYYIHIYIYLNPVRMREDERRNVNVHIINVYIYIYIYYTRL